MRRSAQLLAIAVLGLVTALVAASVGAHWRELDLIVLGTTLVIGWLVELRPVDRAPLPVGFAVVVVLLRATSPVQFVAIVISSTAVAVALRPGRVFGADRLLIAAEWLAAALGAGVVFRIITSATGTESRVGILGALAGAAIVEIAVADVVEYVRVRRVAPLRARSADVALITSGMLMAVGYAGIAGRGQLGLWGPALFSVPLVAAWYSFRLLEQSRRTYRETVQALGTAPELGGLVRPGHVERVATLAVSLGEELEISGPELEDLETAAWLHHLRRGLSGRIARRARAPTRCRLRGPVPKSCRQARGCPRPETSWLRSRCFTGHSREASPGQAALTGQVLKVASAYDELTEGDDSHASWAVDALFTGPAYVYDGRVLAALEVVLRRRGLLPT